MLWLGSCDASVDSVATLDLTKECSVKRNYQLRKFDGIDFMGNSIFTRSAKDFNISALSQLMAADLIPCFSNRAFASYGSARCPLQYGRQLAEHRKIARSFHESKKKASNLV